MPVRPEEKEKIISHFGRPFLLHTEKCLAAYAGVWGLSGFSLVDYFSVNCIFLCKAEKWGNAVLKIGAPAPETQNELNALLAYNGAPFCKVYEQDAAGGLLLLERIQPGTVLRQVPVFKQRAEIFAGLYKGLHKAVNPGEGYPLYTGWVSRITRYMERKEGFSALAACMRRAEGYCMEISGQYNRHMLLHGDLHHDNILKNSEGGYTIIDPKGVAGDPIFDVARFLLNEADTPDAENVCLREKIEVFSKLLGLPLPVLKKCYFIEAAMATCWEVESGKVPDMDCVLQAEAFLA